MHGLPDKPELLSPETQVDFHQLAQEISDRFLLEDPARLIAGESVDVDGVQAAMHCNQYETADRFTLIVDFGAPASGGAAVFANLLNRNFDLVGADAGMFAMDPGNQHVLYARTFQIEKVTALEVIDALMEAVAEAKKWRLDTRNS